MSKKKIIIGTIILIVIASSAILIGFSMSGWSLVKWLNSPYSTTLFIILGITAVILLIVLLVLKDYKDNEKYR